MAAYSRGQVEDFLYHEADLLDSWRMKEWYPLYTEDSEYLVPPIENPDADKETALFIINDDFHRLTQRALRLTKKTAHVEWPRSKVRHLISNVRIVDQQPTEIRVEYNQVVYRAKRGMDEFVCHVKQTLVPDGDSFKIKSKRIMLDLHALRPQGQISIIL
ncbi:MAG: aromatic-ring-hydroxylating dioxygenase subunit beta [Immundisolibacteraceae bacterium]|nr:aromatic-ring-hydroxylating dioxygenase subunit beta [Immundisolibacteraceae bacterium]